ncbi:MAG: hypothetical protein KC496_17675 [Anaerolineae bacterium]|nr:hypothetical protein [Anaerolineae bacterium]
MTYISKRETQAIRGWWWEIKDCAGIYFELIANKPSQQPGRDISGDMVRLHDAQRAVQSIICPIEAENIRWYLLESMRQLQISLADMLADYPDESDKSHNNAHDKYKKACELLSMAGAL